MPLFDFFKKKPKESAISRNAALPNNQNQTQTNSPSSPELQQKVSDAANELLPVFKDRFVLPDGQPDVIMELAAVAWLTGTSLYRAFNDQSSLPPGSRASFSKEVGASIDANWFQLMTYFLMPFSQKRDNASILFQVVSGEKLIQQYKLPMEILQIQEEFQDQFNGIVKKHGLDYLHGSLAGVVVCTLLIREHCVLDQKLDVNAALGIVAATSITAAKTVPANLKPAQSPD